MVTGVRLPSKQLITLNPIINPIILSKYIISAVSLAYKRSSFWNKTKHKPFNYKTRMDEGEKRQ